MTFQRRSLHIYLLLLRRNFGTTISISRAITPDEDVPFKAGKPDWNTVNRIPSISLFSESLNSDSDSAVPLISGAHKPPSVTRVLSQSMSAEARFNLKQWEQRKIDELGFSEFQIYRKNLFSRGHSIHERILCYLTKSSPKNHLSDSDGFWESVSAEIDRFHNVEACEQRLTHKNLGYTGIIDCVACYNSSGLFVIDWKTSEQKKTTLKQTYDQPLQVAAYVGMWNSQHPDQQIDQGMLVMMYEDGSSCDILTIDRDALTHSWALWTERYKRYWQQELSVTPSW